MAERRHTSNEKKAAIFMAVNALVQFVADIVLEGLHLIPTRINHLSLTLLNAFISFKTLSAIQKDKFKFLQEDCQVLWLMEICLVAGDLYYALTDAYGDVTFVYIRIFFVLCSTINFFIITCIMYKYHMWGLSYQGDLEVRKLSVRAISRRVMGSINSTRRASMNSLYGSFHHGSMDEFEKEFHHKPEEHHNHDSQPPPSHPEVDSNALDAIEEGDVEESTRPAISTTGKDLPIKDEPSPHLATVHEEDSPYAPVSAVDV